MKHRAYSRRVLPVTMVAAVLLGGALSGCGAASEDAVAVQSVAMLLGIDLSGNNSYTGVVESKTTQKVARDSSKTVEECYVSVGDLVSAGDLLFTYDVDAIELSVESTQLEIDQLKNSIANYDTQIAQLEKEKKSASSSEQLSYTLQIQTAEKDQAEAEYNLKQKENELTKLQESVSVTAVYAEITGVVQSVNEDDATAYITILETNAYQVKGTATELNVYDLYTGETVVIRSRTTDDTWTGVITEVNTDSTASDEESDYYYYYDSYGESSSKYNFYVELDSSDNLMMGQHVYIQPGTGEEQDGIWLYSSYLAYQDDGSAYVWAAGSNDKLEQRAVELGDYDEETDTYEILSGLTTEDYIAVPDDSYTVGQSVTYYDESSFNVEDETDYEDEDYDDEYYYEIEGDDEYYYEFDDEDYDDEAEADDGSSSSTVTEVTVG